jgi:hypothetical protein
MKQISLTQGKVAIVDDQDYAYLMQYNWCYMKSGNGGYAMRWVGPRDHQRAIFMHQIVAARCGIKDCTDHMNQNKLDNRRNNLRGATSSQNGANRGKNRNNKSGYKGVSWIERLQKWRAYITVNRRQHHLKLWEYKVDAAKAYNQAALKYFGKYAALNKV